MKPSARSLVTFAFAFALMTSVAPTQGFSATPKASTPKLSIKASWLMTTDGHVLWKHNSDKERRVASTIKMLNALVLMDAKPDLSEVVKVPAKAGRTPGIGLVAGERLTMGKLLELMLVASANDAAETIAIHVGGSEQKYVALMNAKAAELGLKHTHAIDPHGLSKREHSTAHDLSVIAAHVMADPVLSNVVGMHSVMVPRPGKPDTKKLSTDSLLGHYAGLIGVKTGFTNPAGYCFVGTAVRGKVALLSVVLGGYTPKSRFTQTRKLLDWGFAGFKTKTLISTTATMPPVAVLGGVDATVGVHPSCDTTAVVWTRSPRTRTVVLPTSVSAPIHRGDQLGVVRISQDGTSLACVALVADSDVTTAAVGANQSPAGALSALPTLWARLGTLSSRAWAGLVAGLHLSGSSVGSNL